LIVRFKKIFYFLLLLVIIIFGLDKIFPLPEDKLFPDTSTIIYFQNGEPARLFLTEDDKIRLFTSYDNIPEKIIKTFILSEDRYFFYHFGINPVSIMRALIGNIRAGKIKSGGSTITMQIARMMEPKKRDIISKIIESLRAIQLELHYSKRKLLEIYLNISPYGSNIEGVGAASYLYFNKPLTALNIQETALLTIIPKNPNMLNPNKGVKQKIFSYYNKLLLKLKNKKIINYDDYKRWSDLETLPKRYLLPFKIPHLAIWLKKRYPNKKRIYTTIEPDIQNSVKKIMESHYKSIKKFDIHNISVIVINNKTKSIISIIGSQGFFDEEGGQIKGFLALRSPGSTLKPFLYALAIEKGVINTETLLKDIPIEFKAYAPKNYMDIYRGLVPVKVALAQSLNVPAVNLLKRIGLNEFYDLLKELEFYSLKDKKNYGLSIVLGGCGVNLLELTKAYTVFPHMGKLYDTKIIKDKRESRPVRIYSDGTAYLISEILRDHRRPDFPENWEYFEKLPLIAWKTGTSYGHFDAWSIGYNPKYTVGVWVGNFNNQNSSDIVGSKVATPLLFKIFDQLMSGETAEYWFKKPNDLIKTEVCDFSGMVPVNGRERTKLVYVLKNSVPNDKCVFHKKYFIDKKTGKIVCPKIMKENRKYDEKIFRVYPPDIALWYKKRGVLLQKLPKIDERCINSENNEPPKIIFPDNNQSFTFPGNLNKKNRKIPLKSDRVVYWFIDNKLIGIGFKLFYTATAGKHIIEVIDENGVQGENIMIKVKIL